MKIKYLIIITLLAACNSTPNLPTDMHGLPYKYYLDTDKMMQNAMMEYGTKIERVIEITRNHKGQIDSAYLSGTQVKWDEYIKPFTKINMHHQEYTGVYTMAQNIDTIKKTVDITYTPIYDNLPVRHMLVTLNTTTNAIKKVYAEVVYKNATAVTKQTLLYFPGSSIQVIEDKQGLSGNGGKTAKQLFLILKESAEIIIGNE